MDREQRQTRCVTIGGVCRAGRDAAAGTQKESCRAVTRRRRAVMARLPDGRLRASNQAWPGLLGHPRSPDLLARLWTTLKMFASHPGVGVLADRDDGLERLHAGPVLDGRWREGCRVRDDAYGETVLPVCPTWNWCG